MYRQGTPPRRETRGNRLNTQIDITGTSPFDAIKRVDENGNEYWLARDLMPLMGYTKWERFDSAISKAKISAANTGTDPDQHFSRLREEPTVGRPKEDYELTRFAAYLIAMNCDVRKTEVANAQGYFAVRTRQAEVSASRLSLPSPEIERAELSNAQVRMLKAAEGLLDTDWLASKAKVVIARGLGEEPEINPDDVPLYVPDFVKAKGVARKADIESIQSWFGRRVAGLYEEAHGIKPGKRTSELPNGQIRETYAWTQRDLTLFEEVWEIHYAARYTPQTALELDS